MNANCQRCNKARATVHVTNVLAKGEIRDLHLCEDCAEKEGVIIKQNQQTTNAILQEFIKQKTATGRLDDLACPKCGTTFREFQAKGLLGCPSDYEAFRSILQPLLERAHGGGTHHVGKVPLAADLTVRRQTGLLRLRRELQEALEQENYERAARVRDQIRSLDVQ